MERGVKVGLLQTPVGWAIPKVYLPKAPQHLREDKLLLRDSGSLRIAMYSVPSSSVSKT